MYIIQWRIQDFPEEGAPTPQGGAPTYDFAIFSRKLHEIERIWAPGGGGARDARPPLRSATVISLSKKHVLASVIMNIPGVFKTEKSLLLEVTKGQNYLIFL